MSQSIPRRPILGLEIHSELDVVERGKATELHLVARITPQAEPVDASRPPLAVVFAVDVSASMAGMPLEHVIKALDKLVELLDERDSAGIVAFSDQASVVAALLPLTAENRRLLKQRSHRLEATGYTNVEDGLRAAFTVLGPRQRDQRQCVILLSDGAPNRGVTELRGLATIAGSAQPDVAVSTLGFGPHHQEDVLHAIADAGHGDYSYIANPLECDYEFARSLGSLGDIVADSVSLILAPRDGAEITEVLSHTRTSFAPAGLRVPIGNILDGLPHYVLARLRLAVPAHVGAWDIATATLEFRKAGSSTLDQVSTPVTLLVRAQAGQPVREAQVRVLLHQAERQRREAIAHADRGHFESAAAILRKLLATIQASPWYRAGDGSDLSEAYEQILDEAGAYERKPSREAYQDFRRMAISVKTEQGLSQGKAAPQATSTRHKLVSRMAGQAPRARLVVLSGEQAGAVHPLAAEVYLGRSVACDIPMLDVMVSRRHARIMSKDGKFYIVDLKSTNVTLCNGKRVDEPRQLQPGDILQLGSTQLRYEEAT